MISNSPKKSASMSRCALRLLPCLLFAFFVSFSTPLPASAAEFEVPAGDVGALIQAINDANENGEPDIITLKGGTYSLTTDDNSIDGFNGLPSIYTDITILGNGSIIEGTFDIFDEGPGDNYFRIFHVSETGILTLDNVTVRGGYATVLDGGQCPEECGGGILNLGVTTLQNGTLITENGADGYGGGVANISTIFIDGMMQMMGARGIEELALPGTLYVDASTVSTNEAYYGGGGIANIAIVDDLICNEASLTRSCLTANSREFHPLESGPMVHIFNGSVIFDNEADVGGGIINTSFFGLIVEPYVFMMSGVSPMVNIEDSQVTENFSFAGGGLANFGSGHVEILRSLFLHNFGLFVAGAILNSGFEEVFEGCFPFCGIASKLGVDMLSTAAKGKAPSWLKRDVSSIQSTLNSSSLKTSQAIARAASQTNTRTNEKTSREYTLGMSQAVVHLDNSAIEENGSFIAGGGILNTGFGFVDIAGSDIFLNAAIFGGGVANLGLFIIDCPECFFFPLAATHSTTQTTRSEHLGDYESSTMVYVFDSSIFNNDAFFGGGLLNAGLYSFADILLSTIEGNAAFAGGGLLNFGFEILDFLFVVEQRTLTEPIVEVGPGATMFVTESTISRNKVIAAGGGIFNGHSFSEFDCFECVPPELLAFLLVDRCTIDNNQTGVEGFNVQGFEEFIFEGPFFLPEELFFLFEEATLGGGIFTGSPTFLFQSTITTNSANYGAGIAQYFDFFSDVVEKNFDLSARVAEEADLRIRNCTITDNIIDINEIFLNPTVAARNGGGPGAGLYSISGSSDIENTILANQRDGAPNCGFDGGFLSNSQYNIYSDDTCGDGEGDKTFTDPKIGPLLPHGGPTLTHALIGGSPAINMGKPNSSPPDPMGTNNGCWDGSGNLFYTDQRGDGFPRPLPGGAPVPMDEWRCDIGAYEFDFDHEPRLTCPLIDITISTDGDSSTAFWPTTNFDFEQGTLTFNCLPTSGSVFPLGTTKVTCTVSDSGGNTETCMFNVTVTSGDEMNKPLIIIDPPEVVVEEGTQDILWLTVFNPAGVPTEDGLELTFPLPAGFELLSFEKDPIDLGDCVIIDNRLECVLASILPGEEIAIHLDYIAPFGPGTSESEIKIVDPETLEEFSLAVEFLVTGGGGGGDSPGSFVFFGNNSSSGCSLAQAGSPISSLLYLLIPAVVFVRRFFRKG